jgi:hypothetical protein
MRDRVLAYVTATVIAALLAGAALYVFGPHVVSQRAEAVLAMCSLALAAELLGHKLASGARGSIAFVPNIAVVALAPSWLAVLGVALSSAIAAAALGTPRVKIAFNSAQSGLATALAIAVYLALGGASLMAADAAALTFSWAELALIAVAAVISMSANIALVCGVMAISQGKAFLPIWRSTTRSGVLYDAISSPIVYLLAYLYARFGVTGAIGFAIPMLGMRQLYKTNRQLEQVNQELLELMVKAIEARDPYTSGHSRRVAQYSRIIARAVGIPSSEVERVATAALLHDVGKIHEIYAPILRKPEKLNPGEWAVMQTHPIKSAELVGTVSNLKDIVAPVRHHHENWDGTGYPDGLQGENIPIGARIVLFADTIDAMTTDRPYRKALTEQQVKSELLKYRGKQFDPEMCDKLLASPMFGLLFSPNQRERTPERTEPIRSAARDRLLAR